MTASFDQMDNPLDAAVGFAELLRDRTHDFNAGVRNNVIKLLALELAEADQVLDDLLLAARVDLRELAIGIEHVGLRRVVDDAVGDFVTSSRARLTVSGNAVARADPQLVSRIVRNLLRSETYLGGENIRVHVAHGFSKVVVEVAHDGDAVPVEEHERIFEPNYLRRNRDGRKLPLGLLLSAARRLARAMGGDVRCIQEENENRFELSLAKSFGYESNGSEIADMIFDPSSRKPTTTAISEILGEDGPEMVYQPIVDMRTHGAGSNLVIGHEGLARFPLASPPEWLEAAGDAGMRLELELSAMRAAIAGFAPAREPGFLALNLSDATLLSSSLNAALEGLDPGSVVLELSEVALIKSYEVTRRAASALRDCGVRLAIDDVGAGELDLLSILRLQPDLIKIDMCLVRDMEHNPTNRALVRGLAAIAGDLGIIAVAERIEKSEERDRLLDLGVEFGQGYLLGKPQPLLWKTRVLSDPDN